MKRGRTITISVKRNPELWNTLVNLPGSGPRGNLTGLRRLYWGRDALVVRYGSYYFYLGADRGQELPFTWNP